MSNRAYTISRQSKLLISIFIMYGKCALYKQTKFPIAIARLKKTERRIRHKSLSVLFKTISNVGYGENLFGSSYNVLTLDVRRTASNDRFETIKIIYVRQLRRIQFGGRRKKSEGTINCLNLSGKSLLIKSASAALETLFEIQRRAHNWTLK